MDIRQQRLERMSRIVPEEAMDRLRNAHAMLFGLGGVGSYAAEALARLGFGKITLVDCDRVSVSNMNRQLPALENTLGMRKTDVVAERLRLAAPDAEIIPIDTLYLPQSPVEIPEDVTVVLDAIDTISAKVDIAKVCYRRNLFLVSCMGMGNRLDPQLIRIGDLFDTSGCPLCRRLRHELRKEGIPELHCVYSIEPAITPQNSQDRPSPGSVAVVPSVAGLYLASEAFRMVSGM